MFLAQSDARHRPGVTTLQPRLAPFPQALETYRGGKLGDCVAALHGHADRNAWVLLARTQIRRGEPSPALAALAEIDDTQLYNMHRGEVLLLSAAALVLCRRLDEARETLDLARIFVFGSGSAALEAEFYYIEAVWSTAMQDLDEMDRAALRALNVPVIAFDRYDYFVPSAITCARALHMRGIVAAGREDYVSTARFLREALAAYATSPSADLWTEASLLMNWAFFVRDFDSPDDAEKLRERVRSADWPADLAQQHFEIYRALGWSSGLRGNHFGAFRDFRRAADLAPSPAHKILASVDRAFLGRELGETHSAREELEYAATLAARIDWNASGEERIALVLLAQELAAFAPERAREMLERYARIKVKLSPLAVNNFDRRPRAHELFAEASVLRGCGANAAAVEKFAGAFTIWEALGYRWLAAKAALELASLGAGESYAAYGAREALHCPNSWLARRVAGLA